MAFRGVRTGTEYGVAYHYDKAGTGSQLTGTGRFKRITGPGLPGYVDPSTPGYGVEYARLANSDLLEYTSYKSDADTTLARTQRDYESNRDLIEWVENKVGTTQVSKYGYTNDDLGRRTSVENSGTAFAATAFNAWGYNPKSELTSSRRYTGEYDPTPDPQAEVLAEKRLYGYDQIGNRLESTEGTASATTYGANDVNAYDWIQPPSPDPQEYFCYDEDGNLLRDGKTSPTCPGTDGLREYKWDAENRLIEVVPISPDDGDKKVKFVYDYMGRRVRKEVFIYDDGWPQENDPDEQWHFVYDGWNVVMVLDGLNSNATTRKYTWGLDLSGTIHGAGGIGGLLACEEPQAPGGPKRYWFLYDGNGNLTQVLDATDTNNISIAAHYEYDPYGNVINNLSSYTYALANPIRFSTKWFDAQTGLGYWGYRYYSPRLGRWMSRDPIGEVGGLNLFALTVNTPTNAYDPDGRTTTQPSPEPTPQYELGETHGVRKAYVTHTEWCNGWVIYEGRLQTKPQALQTMADRACTCISKALEIASASEEDWRIIVQHFFEVYPLSWWVTQEITIPSSANTRPVTWQELEQARWAFVDALRKMKQGCRSGFGFKCECSGYFCPANREGYVWMVPWATTIHLCPKFFDNPGDSRSSTIMHELGHLFGGTNMEAGQLPGSIATNHDDLEAVVDSLCASYEHIKRRRPRR